ncbi:MAG: T9SS type A sorting domain-containing protein [Paludibacter sp.]|nr:T9SS type A sorting domain-containing protein [Paludibacter sp.]
MKKLTFLNRIAIIAIFHVCFLMGISAQGWGYISLPGTGLSGIDCGKLDISTGVITVEAWVMGKEGALASSLDDPQNGFHWNLGEWWGSVNYGGSEKWLDFKRPANSITTWQHLAMVIDGTAVIVYGNGVEAYRVDYTMPFTTSTINDLMIGRNNWSLTSGAVLKIADFRVWNTVRTADEILSNYQSHVDPTSPGLVLNYTFNEQTGDHTANLVDAAKNTGILNDVANVVYGWGKIGVIPTNLATTNKTSNGFDLSWEDSGLDSQWEIQLDDPDGGGVVLQNSEKTATITDLTSTSYTAKVRTISPVPSDWSAPFTVSLTTGLESNQYSNATTINNNGLISINNLEGANDIKVYNVSGSLVKQLNSAESNCKIDATNWAKGMYLIKVNNNNKGKVFKVSI